MPVERTISCDRCGVVAERERHVTWWSGRTEGMPEYLCEPCWDALLAIVRAWMVGSDADPVAVAARQQALAEVNELVVGLLTEVPATLALPVGEAS